MDDSFIDSASPDNNYGAENSLDVHPGNGADQRGLLKFDLSSIPSNAQITEASLYLYEHGNKTGQATFIHRVTSSWSESTVTWQSWIIPGGDFDASISYFTYIPDQNNCLLTIDVTSLVQTWVNGTVPNHGLLLYSTGPDQIISYSSKENGTSNEWPRLNITFIVPTPTP